MQRLIFIYERKHEFAISLDKLTFGEEESKITIEQGVRSGVSFVSQLM